MKIHHIAYLVKDLEESCVHFCVAMGCECIGDVVEDKIQTAKVLFLKTDKDSPMIELITPNSDDSKLTNLLKKTGGGIHHICYETSDIEARIKVMADNGFLQIANPEKAVAFGSRKIAWLMDAKGILIELLEV